MNIRTAVQQLASLIEDKAHEYVKADWLIWWLSDGQREVAKRTFCLRSSSTDTSVAGQGTYSLPDRCIRIERIYYDGYPIDPTDRVELDRDAQDINDEENTTGESWEDEQGTVSGWVHDLHANKIRLVMVPKESGKVIKILYSYMPEEFTAITATTTLPVYAERAMFLFALINAQRHIAVKYDSDKQLRQAQIWQNHARVNEAQYEAQILDIIQIVQQFQHTAIVHQQGVGMEFEEDYY